MKFERRIKTMVSTTLFSLISVFLLSSTTDSTTPAPPPEPEVVVSAMDETVLFNFDEASVGCFRIPIMLRTSKGTIIVATEGRKLKYLRWECDDAGPKFIAIRRSLDDGRTWEPVQFIFNDMVKSTNLGTIFEDEANHTIHIHFVHGFFHKGNTLGLISSNDEGRTWSEPRNISEQLGTFSFIGGPGYGLTKKYPPHKGRMLFCGHSDIPTDGVYCVYSDDYGKNWKWGAEMPAIPFGVWKRRGDFNPDECQPYETPNGDIVVNARNQNAYHCFCRIELVSKDGGETFSNRHVRILEDLPDVIIQGSALYQDGIVFFTAPYIKHPEKKSWLSNRINMTLAWSTNQGKSFDHHYNIWTGGSGYSCLTSIRPVDEFGFGVLGVVYEKGENKSTYWHTVSFARLAYIIK